MRRWDEHLRKADNYPIHKAIQKYGYQSFSFSILEICEVDELNEKEMKYISEYNSVTPDGYNLTSGGNYDRNNYGENHHNSVLTNEDVYNIREDYKNLINVNVAYEKIKHKISIYGFKDIWIGKTWHHIHMDVYTEENKKYHKTVYDRITNHSRVVNDEDVLKIRDYYNEGILSRSEVMQLFPHINENTFSDIWSNHTFKHLQSKKPMKRHGMIRIPR